MAKMLSVRVPPEMHKKAKSIAAQKGISLQEMILEFLKNLK